KAAITATTAGIKTLQVAYGANEGTPQVAGRDSVEFVAAAPSMTNSRVQVSEGTQVANGTDTHTVTVDLFDAWNNPVLDMATQLAKPTITPDTTGLTVTDFEADTTTPGRYTAKVSTTTAGAYTASVTVHGVGEIPAHGLNQVALFVAGAPSSENSTLVAITSGPRQAIVENHTVQLTVLDANENPVPGVDAVITTDPAVALPSDGQVTTNEQGVAQLSFTSTIPQVLTVSAKIAGSVIPQGSGEVTVEFIAGDPATANSFFEISQHTGQIADGTTGFQTVSLYLADNAGVPVPGQANDIEAVFAPTGPTFAKVNAADFEQDQDKGLGWYKATIRSLVAGTFTMTAQIGETDIPVTTDANDKAIFIAGPGDPTTATLSVDNTEVTAGQTVKATVTVIDANGNPAAGQIVHLWVDPAGPAGDAQPISLPADNNGRVTFDLTTTKAGTYTIYAGLLLDPMAPAVEVSNSGEITVTWNPGQPSQSTTTLHGTTGERVADGEDYHEATVRVADQYSNPIPGIRVAIELDGVGTLASNSEAAGDTNSNGIFTARYVSDYVLGQAAVQATVGTDPASFKVTDPSTPDQPKTLAWTWTKQPGEANGHFTVPTNTQPADGSASHTVAIVLLTMDGKPIVGEASNLKVTATPTQDSPPRPAGTTWSVATIQPVSGQPGRYTTTVTSTYAATFTIAVSHDEASLKANPAGQDTITFTAGTVAHPYTSGYEVSETDGIRANSVDTHTIAVTLRDEHGNGIPGATLTAAAAANDALLTKDAWSYNATGVYAATLRTSVAADYTMLVTHGSTPIAAFADANVRARFVPGAPCEANTTLEIVAKATGLPVASRRVGTANDDGYLLRVTVRDRSTTPNPVPGTLVSIVATPDVVPAFADPAKRTSLAGVAEFELKSTKAGEVLVTASIDSGLIVKTGSALFVSLNAPDLANSTLTGTDGETRYADNNAFHTALVTARDRYGNLVRGVPVSISLSGVGYQYSVEPTTGLTDAAGEVSFQIRSEKQVGLALVSAKIGKSGMSVLDDSGVKVLPMAFVAK
ncbi:MAG: Ig-like domain-containing protein, partial [Micrococcales bacterium]|nr:Ig-like domain-containing protein [Micrococcales bacterium]